MFVARLNSLKVSFFIAESYLLSSKNLYFGIGLALKPVTEEQSADYSSSRTSEDGAAALFYLSLSSVLKLNGLASVI